LSFAHRKEIEEKKENKQGKMRLIKTMIPMAQSGFMSNRNEEARSKEKGIRVRLRGDMVLIKSKKN